MVVTLDLAFSDPFSMLMRGVFVANEKRGRIDVLGRVAFEDLRAQPFCVLNGHPRFAEVEPIRLDGAAMVAAARAAIAQRSLRPAIGRALLLYGVQPIPFSNDELIIALDAAIEMPRDTLRPCGGRQYLGLYHGELGFWEEPFIGNNTAFLGMRYV